MNVLDSIEWQPSYYYNFIYDYSTTFQAKNDINKKMSRNREKTSNEKNLCVVCAVGRYAAGHLGCLENHCSGPVAWADWETTTLSCGEFCCSAALIQS